VELPILERADELVAAIAAHQVVIVAGETGSGKSTQLPQLCLRAGRGVDGGVRGAVHRSGRRRPVSTKRIVAELVALRG
jgi:ATP-dependent helicase HrpA